LFVSCFLSIVIKNPPGSSGWIFCVIMSLLSHYFGVIYMPVKKTSKTSKARASKESIIIKPEPKKDKQMGLFFIIFILIVSLIVISFALYRVSNEQTRLIGVINSLSDEVSQQQTVIVPDDSDEIKIQYRDSNVQGLQLAYTPCLATFTGPCDDLLVYRLNKNGSKEVLVPSVRVLSGAPLTNELLQPLSVNSDFSYIVFGAWAYGGKRNSSDKRIWVVETTQGKVVAQSDLVPTDAVFSADMTYAAYYMEDEDDELIMVIDLTNNEEFLVARAKSGITYKDANSKVIINWLDAETVAVIQYEIDEDGGDPTIIGEREITIN